MGWSEWSSIAEIIGSAANVVTLVYLSLQIRQSTNAMQSAGREATAAGDVEWLYKLVDHPELGMLFRKQEALSELEASRLNACLVAFMRLKEVNFRQYKAGILDKDTWGKLSELYRRWPACPTKRPSVVAKLRPASIRSGLIETDLAGFEHSSRSASVLDLLFAEFPGQQPRST